MKTDKYKDHLILDEKSEATVSKYIRDVTAYIKWLDGREMSKELTIQYKEELVLLLPCSSKVCRIMVKKGANHARAGY